MAAIEDKAMADTVKPDDSTPELYIDPVAEKKLLRKLDIYLAPLMTIIFLCAYLDRSNIGNAASAGMIADIGATSSELGNAVTLFYVTYVAAELPCSVSPPKTFLVVVH
jgi:sugar phosphate permease